MPLLRFDVITGRNEAELTGLLDATHEAMLAAFGVPERDRYQVIHEHKAGQLRIEDTGLGIERSDKVVLLQVTSRRRTTEQKQNFYRLLCERLLHLCGITANDVVVSFLENSDADWSFGHGEAQFLTGRLS